VAKSDKISVLYFCVSHNMVLVVAVFLSKQNPLLNNFRDQIVADVNLHSSEYYKCTIQLEVQGGQTE